MRGFIGLMISEKNWREIYLSRPSKDSYFEEQRVFETTITHVNWDYDTRLVWRLRDQQDGTFDVPDRVLDYISNQKKVTELLPSLLFMYSSDVLGIIFGEIRKDDILTNMRIALE